MSHLDYHIRENYKAWYIGITDNEKIQRQLHGYPPYWATVNIDDRKTGSEVKKYYLGLGVHDGGMGTHDDPQYAYIFKLRVPNF